jgi:tRNA threonylcarbamoyladenosine biosynthesis protein TsaE
MHAFLFSESQLADLASKVISDYPEFRIFTFQGDLGAGKTSFIKALCRELQIVDDVTSPTFSLVNEYETKDGNAVFHMDLYRLENEDELLNIGLEDYLHSGSYCFIEWPAVAEAYYDDHVHISIEILAKDYRKFTLHRKTYV